jgi:hypothetical protein
MEERRVDGLTEEEMLARLRRTLMKEGRLSPAIMDKTVGLPCRAVFIAHFGSIRNAYRLIGYSPRRNYDYLDTRQNWATELTKLASQITAMIEKVGGRIVSTGSTGGLQVNGKANLFFRAARWVPEDKGHCSQRWTIYRQHLPDGWIVTIRLGDHNKSALDYLLVPTTSTDRNIIRFTEKNRARLGIVSFETPRALIRSLIRLVARSSSGVTATPGRPSNRSRSSRSKRVTGRARH